MPRPIEFVLAAVLLLLPSVALASAPGSANRSLGGAASSVDSATDVAVKTFNGAAAAADRSPMTLAVNGRVVATDKEGAAAVAKKWNWTLLLLGCAGLVVSQFARRRSRRPMISQ